MSYKLQFAEASAFSEILSNTLQMWCSQAPDVYLISSEGLKIYSQKILLCFYSPLLREALSDITSHDMPAITVPDQAENITTLLKVLETGSVVSSNKDAFLGVGDVARLLGIAFNSNGLENYSDEIETIDPFVDIHQDIDVNQFMESSQEYSFENEDDSIDFIKEEVGAEFGKYNCDQCGKQFTKYERLSQHLVVHMGILFPCEVCGKEFKRESGLNNHTKKVHESNSTGGVEKENHPNGLNNPLDAMNNLDDVNKPPGEVDSENKVDEFGDQDERKYKCEQCQATFKKNAHLERHMLIHTGEKPFSCDVCEKSFSRKDKLKKHCRTHRNILGHEVDF